jgi:hypothetical protein
MGEEDKEEISKKHMRRKIVVVILVVITISMSLVAWYLYIHRYAPGKITFQQYEPTYWPSGSHINERIIEAMYIPSAAPDRYTRLYLEMSDGSGVFETERKYMQLTYKCPDGKATNESCTVGYTSKGEPYLLYTTSFDGKVAYQFIKWSRKDTDIGVRLDTVPEGGYSEEEVERIIQSFKPVEYKNLEIRHVDRSVI